MREGDGRRHAPLHAGHLLVALVGEAQLAADHGLERRVEVGHAELDQLGEALDERRVHHLVHGLGLIVLLLGLRATHTHTPEQRASQRREGCRRMAEGRRRTLGSLVTSSAPFSASLRIRDRAES